MIWGLRLAIHIYLRNRGKKEDFRYLAWRQEWGKAFYLRSYFQVYLLQGLFLLMVISPVTLASTQEQGPLIPLDYLGILVWIIGFYFQTVGDYQLVKFKKDPANKGKIMTSGLWRFSRHPNYFGEVTMWWGLFLLSVNSPYGIYGIIGPLTISFLIIFVSGIPMMEEKYKENPEFEAYSKVTSVFIPMPQKSN
jgi:steroid 5-alpha reductase family enzyme